MKVNNQLKLQRLIGKVDNDFNISESDWIPRVAAWVTDALSQMKVLPMVKKRRTLEVSDKIAQFPCMLNTEEIVVLDSNGVEIPYYDKNKDCCENKANNSSTGELIGVANTAPYNGWETTVPAKIVNGSNKNYVLDGNNIILNFDTDSIIVESYEVATYHDDYYDCECPYIYNNGLLLEALSWYILYKYLSRGSSHQVYSIKSNNQALNPYLQWINLKGPASISVAKDINKNTDGWNNFFYNSTFLPRN